MKLPNVDRAFVEPTKLRDYLLSRTHPVGRFKAAYFVRLGYRRVEWKTLQNDLLSIARRGDAVPRQEAGFGRKFEVDGILISPLGRMAEIRTVWIVANDQAAPRFVTAYPR